MVNFLSFSKIPYRVLGKVRLSTYYYFYKLPTLCAYFSSSQYETGVLRLMFNVGTPIQAMQEKEMLKDIALTMNKLLDLRDFFFFPLEFKFPILMFVKIDF